MILDNLEYFYIGLSSIQETHLLYEQYDSLLKETKTKIDAFLTALISNINEKDPQKMASYFTAFNDLLAHVTTSQHQIRMIFKDDNPWAKDLLKSLINISTNDRFKNTVAFIKALKAEIAEAGHDMSYINYLHELAADAASDANLSQKSTASAVPSVPQLKKTIQRHEFHTTQKNLIQASNQLTQSGMIALTNYNQSCIVQLNAGNFITHRMDMIIGRQPQEVITMPVLPGPQQLEILIDITILQYLTYLADQEPTLQIRNNQGHVSLTSLVTEFCLNHRTLNHYYNRFSQHFAQRLPVFEEQDPYRWQHKLRQLGYLGDPKATNNNNIQTTTAYTPVLTPTDKKWTKDARLEMMDQLTTKIQVDRTLTTSEQASEFIHNYLKNFKMFEINKAMRNSVHDQALSEAEKLLSQAENTIEKSNVNFDPQMKH